MGYKGVNESGVYKANTPPTVLLLQPGKDGSFAVGFCVYGLYLVVLGATPGSGLRYDSQ